MSPFIKIDEQDTSKNLLTGLIKNVQKAWTIYQDNSNDLEHALKQILNIEDGNFNDTQITLMS